MSKLSAVPNNRVLLVEPDPTLRKWIEEALESPDIGLVVHAGPESITPTALEHIDLAIIDRHLPQDGASELLASLRTAHPDVECIFLTDEASTESVREAMSLGVYAYLLKPDLKVPRLQFLVNNAIGRSALRREQSALMNQLQASELRYELVTRSTTDGVWDWDLERDRAYFSPRFKQMLGYRDADLEADIEEWFSRIHPDDVERLRQLLSDHLEDRTPYFECEYRMLHKDGAYRWFSARGSAHGGRSGRVERMAGSHTDITQRRRAEEQLLHDAFHDRLTGLPNRNLILDRVDQAVARAGRSNERVAVALLNIDRFNLVNQGLGFASGDELLKDMAVRLRRTLRESDTLGRLGGDLFSMVLGSVEGPEQCVAMTQRVKAELAQPFRVGDREIYATMRMGISMSGEGDRDAEHLLRDAEIAMGRAKSSSDGYAFFEGTMQGHSARLLELDASLRRGLQQGELVPYLQPIVEQPSGAVVGFETLARWRQPDGNVVEPADFMPWAERSGLIRDINQCIFRRSMKAAAVWNSARDRENALSLNINVTYEEIRERGFVDRITELCKETGLETKDLSVEVLENLLVRDPEGTAVKLGALRDLGVRIGLDDFGTGYSSLGYLYRMPVDYLKVDRSFIHAMEREPRAMALVRSVFAMAGELGLSVVAEGVETREQHDVLVSIGYTRMQGYYYARPVAIDEIAQRLERDDKKVQSG